MRLEELAPDILRRWWIVLIAAFVAGLVGYLAVSGDPDEYSASARIAIDTQPADFGLDQYAKSRLATYQPLITSHAFMQGAMSGAGLDIDPGYARGTVSVTHDSIRNTLTISSVDSDPNRAADIANAVQQAVIELNESRNAAVVPEYQRISEEYAPRVVLTALDTAGPPSSPTERDEGPTVLAAAMLGAIAGGLVVVLLVYRDDALRSREDVERYLGQPLLAIVPAATSTLER